MEQLLPNESAPGPVELKTGHFDFGFWILDSFHVLGEARPLWPI
jgi:hypothetical protein